MSKSNALETAWLLLLFNNTNIANVGDGTGLRGSSTAGSLYLSLHTADPGEAGSQTTNEVSYTGYARVAVARSGAGFTVSGNQASLASAAQFGQRSDVGSTEAMYFGIGTDISGAGTLLYSGPLVGSNTTLAGTAAVSDDVTIPGSTYSVNDRVVFFAVGEGALPTGITHGTVYYIKTAPGGGVYTLSATQGGATLDITGAGGFLVAKLSTITIAQNSIPQLNTGTKVIED